jgi:hypothetical protein
MDYKYNLYFKNKYQALFIYTHVYPIRDVNKLFKLLYQQYEIIDLNLEEFNDLKKKFSNNILEIKNNIIIIKSNQVLSKKNAFDKLWFYTKPDNIYDNIINSYNNKLNKLNYKLYDYIISDFKFRDIFILLYNNESI